MARRHSRIKIKSKTAKNEQPWPESEPRAERDVPAPAAEGPALETYQPERGEVFYEEEPKPFAVSLREILEEYRSDSSPSRYAMAVELGEADDWEEYLGPQLEEPEPIYPQDGRAVQDMLQASWHESHADKPMYAESTIASVASQSHAVVAFAVVGLQDDALHLLATAFRVESHTGQRTDAPHVAHLILAFISDNVFPNLFHYCSSSDWLVNGLSSFRYSCTCIINRMRSSMSTSEKACSLGRLPMS